jgi:tRNA (cmo5U34)-methyltransferase
MGGWSDVGKVEWYAERIGRLEARVAGERMVVDVLPAAPRSLLDLGCGDGRLTELALACRPSLKRAVAVDRSLPMLERARERFQKEPRVEVQEWDVAEPIAPLGRFDLIVSGFAIHHLEDDRKQELFSEIARQLETPGTFVNLEVVASATAERHADFLAAIGRTADDPEDRLAPLDDQLRWLRDAGMTNVDCLWRWRGFAVLAGEVRESRGRRYSPLRKGNR